MLLSSGQKTTSNPYPPLASQWLEHQNTIIRVTHQSQTGGCIPINHGNISPHFVRVFMIVAIWVGGNENKLIHLWSLDLTVTAPSTAKVPINHLGSPLEMNEINCQTHNTHSTYLHTDLLPFKLSDQDCLVMCDVCVLLLSSNQPLETPLCPMSKPDKFQLGWQGENNERTKIYWGPKYFQDWGEAWEDEREKRKEVITGDRRFLTIIFLIVIRPRDPLLQYLS